MSTEDNKRLVRRLYEEIFNTGNVDALPEVIAPDYVEVHDGVRYPMGIEGARSHVLGVRENYGRLRLVIERQIAEGDWVVTQLVARGVHRGEWLGIKPTGKPVEFTAVNVDKVVDGRIVEHGGAANMLGPLLGIGAVKVVGPEDDGEGHE